MGCLKEIKDEKEKRITKSNEEKKFNWVIKKKNKVKNYESQPKSSKMENEYVELA